MLTVASQEAYSGRDEGWAVAGQERKPGHPSATVPRQEDCLQAGDDGRGRRDGAELPLGDEVYRIRPSFTQATSGP